MNSFTCMLPLLYWFDKKLTKIFPSQDLPVQSQNSNTKLGCEWNSRFFKTKIARRESICHYCRFRQTSKYTLLYW